MQKISGTICRFEQLNTESNKKKNNTDREEIEEVDIDKSINNNRDKTLNRPKKR